MILRQNDISETGKGSFGSVLMNQGLVHELNLVPCINYMESSVTEISLAEDKEEQFQNTCNNIVI